MERGKGRKSSSIWEVLNIDGLDWRLEDIPITTSEDGMMFLTNIDAVSFHGFRSILQHEVRYPLAEAMNLV